MKYVIDVFSPPVLIAAVGLVASGAWYVSAQDARVSSIETNQQEIKTDVSKTDRRLVEAEKDIATIKSDVSNTKATATRIEGSLEDVKEILMKPNRPANR